VPTILRISAIYELRTFSIGSSLIVNIDGSFQTDV